MTKPNQMKHLRELVITVLLIGLCFLGYRYYKDGQESSSKIMELEKEKESLQVQYDSANAQRIRAEHLTMKALTEKAKSDEAVTRMKLANQIANEKHERLLRGMVPRLSVHQLDSARAALWPH